MISEVENIDCVLGIKKFPDKFFDLAIVDPPYGIGESKRATYHPNANTVYLPKKWDKNIPTQYYFMELFRVSKNQIIWGGNYFILPPKPKYIIWDKIQPEGIDQAMCEFAWTSITDKQTKIFRRSPSLDKNCISNSDFRSRQTMRRIHPTQKPVALYKWLLKNYAIGGDKILDTHMGSQSSRIAAFNMGFDYWGYELDKDYFEHGNKRFKEQTMQQQLFK